MHDITKSPLTRGNLMGGALLMHLGFAYVVAFAISFFCLIFDSSGRVLSLIADNNIILSYALNTFIVFVTLFLFFAVIVKVLGLNIAQTCALGLPDRKGLALPCIFISLSMTLYGVVFTNLLSAFTETVFHAVPYEPEFTTDCFTPFTFIFVLINSALVPALIEEFTFRGAILGIFRRYGDLGAILISTVMFSLAHGNFVQIPYTFMFGLGLGLTRMLTNSIWPCIVAHFINNAFVAVIDIIPDNYNLVSISVQLFMLALYGILGIISYIRLSNRDVIKNLTKSNPPFIKTSGKDLCKALFAPLNVIAIIVLLICAFTNFKAV